MAQKPQRGRGEVPAPHTWEYEQKIKIKVALRSLTAKAEGNPVGYTEADGCLAGATFPVAQTGRVLSLPNCGGGVLQKLRSHSSQTISPWPSPSQVVATCLQDWLGPLAWLPNDSRLLSGSAEVFPN